MMIMIFDGSNDDDDNINSRDNDDNNNDATGNHHDNDGNDEVVTLGHIKCAVIEDGHTLEISTKLLRFVSNDIESQALFRMICESHQWEPYLRFNCIDMSRRYHGNRVADDSITQSSIMGKEESQALIKSNFVCLFVSIPK
jgi:hypothetical protein